MTSLAAAPTQPIRFKIDTARLQGAFEDGPSTVYYWLRGYLRGSLITHRTGWLASKGTAFGRGGGADSKAIRVWRIDEAPAGTPQDNWIVYEVHPREKRLEPAAARLGLTNLTASIHAGSIVLQVHQEGPTINSRGLMAIAVKTRPKTPAAWRAKNPQKELVLRPGRNGALLLLERTRVRGRGRPRKDGSGGTTAERMRLRFVLVKQVKMRPTLKFYESWDAQGGERARQFSFVADRILADIAKGIA